MNSKKRCKFCKSYFPAGDMVKVPAGTFCTIEHAMEFANQPKEREKADRKRHKAKKEAIRDNDRGYWLKKAQAAFNAFIRARDDGSPCISCDRTTGSKKNAGHYRSVGACPELRFEELNAHLQCEHCNSYNSGNIVEYRPRLKAKIGADKLAWIEGPHEAKKYTVADLKQIELTYKQKLKELTE